MNHLVDTNVLSELQRCNPSSAVLRWFHDVSADSLYLSALTVGEVRRGIERVRPRSPGRAAQLEAWLGGLLKSYRRRVLTVDLDVARRWGELGLTRPLPVVDSLIAATALMHDMTVATRHVADFEPTGVRTVNPFEA